MPDPVTGSLDPTHYIEHVTRTALLLESLARDVKTLTDETKRSLSNTESLRISLNQTDREFAVYKAEIAGKISTNKENIEILTERIKWLNRLVISALVTGAIGGIIAIIFKSL